MNTTLLIGYGTLLSPTSARKTVADLPAPVPVRVPGFVRIYDVLPDHYVASTVLAREGYEERAAANVRAADSTLAALAYTIRIEDLPAMDERERYYRRQAVPCMDFETGVVLGKGMIYIADSRLTEEQRGRTLPRWRDYVLARGGAYACGQDVGRLFDAGTLLADGKTPALNAYAAHEEQLRSAYAEATGERYET